MASGATYPATNMFARREHMFWYCRPKKHVIYVILLIVFFLKSKSVYKHIGFINKCTLLTGVHILQISVHFIF